MESSIKNTFYPLFLLMSFAVLQGLRGLLEPKIALNMITTAGVFVMIAVTMIFERALPYNKKWNESHGDSLSDFALTMVVFPAIINLCRWLVDIYPAQLKLADLSHFPLWLQVVVGIFLAEFFFYWIHRASHESKLLWRFHKRHHSAKRVYWMNSGTLNPVDMLLNFLGYCLPFVILKTELPALEYVLYFTAVTGLLEHANVNFNAGFLNYIFNTAELHRWHHSVEVDESQKNYGKGLSTWDLVFGTFYFPKNKHVKEVGIK